MNYEELIDKHFSGNLSGEETKILLEEVKKHPHVEEEFNFQDELTTSIKVARKRELKATLASLPVPKAYSSTPIYLGAAAIIGVLFSGIYFFNSEENKPTTLETPTEQVAVFNEVPAPSELTEKTSKEAFTEAEEPNLISTEKVKETEKILVQPEVENNTSLKNTAAKKPATVQKKIQYNIQEPSVNPAIAEFDNVHENSDINAPSNNLTSTTKDNKVSEIVPKIEVNNKSYRKYQYDGQNLTLVGDFNSDVPYVLYELKLNTEKQLYLKFENQYYAIKNTGSKTNKLETLTDQVVINELENK